MVSDAGGRRQYQMLEDANRYSRQMATDGCHLGQPHSSALLRYTPLHAAPVQPPAHCYPAALPAITVRVGVGVLGLGKDGARRY